MSNFAWQNIKFINGGNPYICKTKNEFKKMKNKYVLEKIDNNSWEATYKITYEVVGFNDLQRQAKFNKEYITKNGANRRIKQAISNKEFKRIILRRNTSYLKNNDSLEMSVSEPIKFFEYDNIKDKMIGYNYHEYLNKRKVGNV